MSIIINKLRNLQLELKMIFGAGGGGGGRSQKVELNKAIYFRSSKMSISQLKKQNKKKNE